MLRAALEQLLISIELEKSIMIDVAQNLMSLGESIAAAHTASVNDNMIRSHYLYFVNSFATSFFILFYANFCNSSSNNSADVLKSNIPLG